jgi:thiol-disulfide isomerase/thioredoxin
MLQLAVKRHCQPLGSRPPCPEPAASAESFRGSASGQARLLTRLLRVVWATSLHKAVRFTESVSRQFDSDAGRPAYYLAFLTLLFLLAPASAWPRPQEQQAGNVIRFVRNPDTAPDFKLDDLDGKPLTLSAAHGKVILLNFWATWCGPCRAEIPDLIELQTKYKDRLQIIGISVDDDDADAVKKVVTQTGINYPVAMASPEVRMQYGGIVALPTSFVLDTEGRVVQKHEGLHDPLLYEIEVRALLGMPIPGRVETFEDTGEIFLKHADRALELPGVDMAKLTPEQKQAALHRFNAESCTCGCNFTLAQCRIYDRGCAISKGRTEKIVAEVSGSSSRKNPPAKSSAPAKTLAPPDSALPNPSPR